MDHLAADKHTRVLQEVYRHKRMLAGWSRHGRHVQAAWNDHDDTPQLSSTCLPCLLGRYCSTKLEQASHPTQHDGTCSVWLQAHYQHTVKHMGCPHRPI